MLKPDSLASRMGRWFLDRPGLHNAITLEELRAALGVVSHTIGQRISCDLRPLGVNIVCKLTYSDGVTTDEARLLGIRHDDKPRYRYYLPMESVAKARKVLAAAPDQNGNRKAEEVDTPTSIAASDVPPPTSEAHSPPIKHVPWGNTLGIYRP